MRCTSSKGEPPMPAARSLVAALLALLVWTFTLAARPIVDLHRLDAYFALYASDSNVPWKAATVRLDTYSSAPVHFAIYAVDPADVLSAGSNARSRAIDTRTRRAIARLTFTPPGGYQFQPNEVSLPLGSRAGFFVVEVRRGGVGEQVWVNRSRVALVAKQTPAELLLYGVDLGTGNALPHMRVQLLVQDRFVTAYTNAQGVVRYSARPRPIFALAQWGASYAFISPLPQAPSPQSIVAVRTDSAVVRAGESLRVVGFARARTRGGLRPASGTADVSLRDGATILAQQRVALDPAGAFSAELDVPENTPAGDDAVIAQVGGNVASASERVDADAAGLSLSVSAPCGDRCDARADVPLEIASSRGDVTVHLSVVRWPHVYVGSFPGEIPWGATIWLDRSVTTDASGHAEVMIPHPTDDLASTYGVRADSGGATASTRIVVPTSAVALRLDLQSTVTAIGSAIAFDVDAATVRNAKPDAGARVVVTLSHGAEQQQQTLVLDENGRARGSFTSPDFGTNLIVARLSDAGAAAADAAQLQVVPQTETVETQNNSGDVTLHLDRMRYRPGEPVDVDAQAPGASGSALLTLEGSNGIQVAEVPVAGGRASARLRAVDADGALTIGAVFVRDGATLSATMPLDIDGPGSAESTTISVVPSPQPGAEVSLSLDGAGSDRGTAIVRLSSGEPSGGALFSTLPQMLAPDVNTTQSSAEAGVTWHPWVDSTGKHPSVLEFVRRTVPPPNLELTESDSRTLTWRIERLDGSALHLQLPSEAGRYTLSVLAIGDDGRVIAGSAFVSVP
jgi:hypothetical protein